MNLILEQAIQERDDYIKKHPHLKNYQTQIDDVLDKTPEEYRFSVISVMLLNKLDELMRHIRVYIELNQNETS